MRVDVSGVTEIILAQILRAARAAAREGTRTCPPPVEPSALTPARSHGSQVTMEDYPEAGMSALKYYTIQSYTK